MRKQPLLLINIGMICATHTGWVFAESMQERLEAMEKLLQTQQQTIQQQQVMIERMQDAYTPYFKSFKSSDETPPKTQDHASRPSVEVSGQFELKATYTPDNKTGNPSDLTVPTAKIAVHARANEWVSGDLVALYGEESDNKGDLGMDVARINVADPENNWFVYAGQYTLPFVASGSHMITNPITLDLAEVKDTALEVGVESDHFRVSAFVFQGDYRDTLENYGIVFNTTHALGDATLSGHLGYINNLAESNSIAGGGWVQSNAGVPAWTAGAKLNLDKFSLIGSYVAATSGFVDANDERPAAYHLEGAWHFDALEKPTTLALSYQASDDAENVHWGLAEQRSLAGLSIQVLENAVLKFEYKQDADYAGEETDMLTSRLTVDF